MQCTYHPGVEATTTCTNRGSAICNQAVVLKMLGGSEFLDTFNY
jgi:hypothetical protein